MFKKYFFIINGLFFMDLDFGHYTFAFLR